MGNTVMALDLSKRTGFAVGDVGQGEQPHSGVLVFGGEEASHEAIFHNALQWLSEAIRKYRPTVVVWEAPLPPIFKRGKTNVETTSLLFGLPAIAGTAAYSQGVFDIRKAEAKLIRNHFIGCNPKRSEAKRLTKQQCTAMGWHFKDDNEADALAVWHYMCSLIEPKILPPFLQRGKRA